MKITRKKYPFLPFWRGIHWGHDYDILYFDLGLLGIDFFGSEPRCMVIRFWKWEIEIRGMIPPRD